MQGLIGKIEDVTCNILFTSTIYVILLTYLLSPQN